MQITLLEPLGIPERTLEQFTAPLLALGHTFTACKSSPFDAEIIEQAKDADIVMLGNKRLSGNVIRALPRLQFLSVAFTGVDHVDLAACKERGIALSNAAGYATASVAELTLCMMLTLLRKVLQADNRTRECGTREGLIGNELRGKTVGVVGTGAIGLEVAKLCTAFGCRVVACAPHPKQEALRMGVSYLSLDELMQTADIVSLHVPLSDETRCMIDGTHIAMMKPTAFLINMARGPVVDNGALALALRNRSIAGAAVDVYEKEPPLYPGHPLLNAPNTICTPHVAFATAESMQQRAQIAFENVTSWLSGRQINRVL